MKKQQHVNSICIYYKKTNIVELRTFFLGGASIFMAAHLLRVFSLLQANEKQTSHMYNNWTMSITLTALTILTTYIWLTIWVITRIYGLGYSSPALSIPTSGVNRGISQKYLRVNALLFAVPMAWEDAQVSLSISKNNFGDIGCNQLQDFQRSLETLLH